ncbi:sensor histidine kinase [Cytobacillus sp. Hz8]
MMKERILIYLAIMIFVPIGGEFKFFPLEGDLRVSLGTPVFFFFLLWSRKINVRAAGFLVGTSVVAFRMCLEFLFNHHTDLYEIFIMHFPAFFYYLTFSLLFYLLKVNELYQKPLLLGFMGTIMEISASTAEILFRHFFSNDPITVYTYFVIAVIAIIRSFFVLGFFNIMILREMKTAEEKQRLQNQQMLVHISHLFVEMIQLKKSMKNTEELTQVCYKLYRDLKKKESLKDFAATALKIAGQVHEIKKDHQRIHAGLAKLTVKDHILDYMDIEEIIQVVISANESYSTSLGKSIHFKTDINGSHRPYHTFILLSILNNLYANAVEAIKEHGWIHIHVNTRNELIEIEVTDNGPGISPRAKEYIFEPGFTTKFDSEGNASNGIGLSYIKNLIQDLKGTIHLDDQALLQHETKFQIHLPINSLVEKG